MHKLYKEILANKQMQKKSFAVLVDPDDIDLEGVGALARKAALAGVDFFFVGGSLITDVNLGVVVQEIKANCSIPVVIFPGNGLHITPHADAILFLSLISGRNADNLIGQHVIAAPLLKRTGIEVLSTGYMLIDSGKQTTVSYISNTTPIPMDKPVIGACTAMAGEMLGMKLIYLDAGSGAENQVSSDMIAAVAAAVEVPVIVGGGINSVEKAIKAWTSGADIVVIGNGIEQNGDLMSAVADGLKTLTTVIG
jgi:putative glycerol-1-phosphate prenyltransferase